MLDIAGIDRCLRMHHLHISWEIFLPSISRYIKCTEGVCLRVLQGMVGFRTLFYESIDVCMGPCEPSEACIHFFCSFVCFVNLLKFLD